MIAARRGHLVGLSSNGDGVSSTAPSYAASKAGLSSYLGGLTLALRPRGAPGDERAMRVCRHQDGGVPGAAFHDHRGAGRRRRRALPRKAAAATPGSRDLPMANGDVGLGAGPPEHAAPLDHARLKTRAAAPLAHPRVKNRGAGRSRRASRQVTCRLERCPSNHRSPPHVAFAGAWSATTSTADHAPAKAPSGGSRAGERRRTIPRGSDVRSRSGQPKGNLSTELASREAPAAKRQPPRAPAAKRERARA